MSDKQASDAQRPRSSEEWRQEVLRRLREQKGRGAVHDFRVQSSVERLSDTRPDDIQGIAARQIELLAEYHRIALSQARRSFFWALVGAVVGLGCFLAAVVFLLLEKPQETAAVVSVIAGALVEVMSGINFYLYGKASAQLAQFHGPLDRTQRFLLANSVCSALKKDEIKDQTRADLVRAIAGASLLLEDENAGLEADSEAA